jgi:hypothetical protein
MIYQEGAALFTIFVKGAGLSAADRNLSPGKTLLMIRKPASLTPTRVRHPKLRVPISAKISGNRQEILNHHNLACAI